MSCMCGKCDNVFGWGRGWYSPYDVKCPPRYNSPTFTDAEKIAHDVGLWKIMEKARDELRDAQQKFLRRHGFRPCKPIEERG